jgi:hypothetical protein
MLKFHIFRYLFLGLTICSNAGVIFPMEEESQNLEDPLFKEYEKYVEAYKYNQCNISCPKCDKFIVNSAKYIENQTEDNKKEFFQKLYNNLDSHIKNCSSYNKKARTHKSVGYCKTCNMIYSDIYKHSKSTKNNNHKYHTQTAIRKYLKIPKQTNQNDLIWTQNLSSKKIKKYRHIPPKRKKIIQSPKVIEKKIVENTTIKCPICKNQTIKLKKNAILDSNSIETAFFKKENHLPNCTFFLEENKYRQQEFGLCCHCLKIYSRILKHQKTNQQHSIHKWKNKKQ